MRSHGHRVTRFAAFSILILLIPHAGFSRAAAPGKTPAPDALRAARHWAGDFTLHQASRVERAGQPGALSDLKAAQRSAMQRAGSPVFSPSGLPADGVWSLLAGSQCAINGPGRLTHAAIYDPVRHRTVIFGGGGGNYLNDTWVLNANGSSWTQLATQGDLPAPRRLHSAIYDSQNDRMVVFGGYDGTFYNDVWALSFSTDPPSWSQLAPGGDAPAARAGHAAVYDANDHRMIVFAGYDGVSESSLRRDDVWSLSLDGDPAWTNITPEGASPGVRSSLDAAYDSQRDRMVIFGGTGPGFLDDTWALDLSATPAWSQLAVEGARPPAREEHSAIYDAANDRVIIYGGYDAEYYFGDTWSLPLADPSAWIEMEPTGLTPDPRWGQTAVYDNTNDKMILFGGWSYGTSGETFVLNLAGTPAWSNPVVLPGPGPMRHTFASAYDSQRHRYVLFGGSNVYGYLNDTWVIGLDGVPQWSSLATAGTPPSPRRLVEAIYDPVGDRMIVYGGANDGPILGDLYELSFATDPPTWSPLAASGGPPAARAGHGMIYDPVGQRMIVFGGWDGVSTYYRRNDVWALNLDADPDWQELSPEGTPPSPRSSPSVVYDSDRQQMVVFGGTTTTFLNDAWALSLGDSPAWSQIQASGTPPTAREEQSGVYDPVRGRMVIVGGYIDPYFSSTHDTWALTLGDAPSWTQLSPGGPQPPSRWGHAAMYDPASDRMIMHGGLGGGLDQTWALTWGTPQSSAPILIEAQSDPGVVRLTWGVDGGAYFKAAVYRSANGGPWLQASDIPIDAAGHAIFVDHAVTGGTRYGYRAGVKAGATEKLSSPAYVDATGSVSVGDARTELAIFGARPAGAELAVWLSLASGDAARLALVDVGGRTVAAQDLGAGGAGSRQVSLAGRGGITPGVYWLRLSQAGRTVSAKTVMWR
jgi:hypothetical protein